MPTKSERKTPWTMTDAVTMKAPSGPSDGFQPAKVWSASVRAIVSNTPPRPATIDSTVASASSVPKITRRPKPIAFRTASSPARSRTPMEAVLAAMNTMQRATRPVTTRMMVTNPLREPKKLEKKLFSVSEAVSASLLRDSSSTARMMAFTRSGSAARTQMRVVMPRPGRPWAFSASSR